MQLHKIGFYTLHDDRAKSANQLSRLSRCELIVTDRCNFSCPYCRGIKSELKGDMPFRTASNIIQGWIDHRLKNIRFSGGEPTLYPHLFSLVDMCREGGIKRIALSTNGSASLRMYGNLIEAGVNDFSISLDACCSSTGSVMAGRKDAWEDVLKAIKFISSQTYTTVGVVLTEKNLPELANIVSLAEKLGVQDIRIIPAAQVSKQLSEVENLDKYLHEKFPILAYRLNNAFNGRNVRGLTERDNPKCPLVLDDMAIVGKYHFPCIIYLREQGEPIGNVDTRMDIMRSQRASWWQNHNCYEDRICRENCLDVCVDYNNRWREFHLA
jgi:MoaA/NifB/PqqE/SkfB family radical SAM enzyme